MTETTLTPVCLSEADLSQTGVLMGSEGWGFRWLHSDSFKLDRSLAKLESTEHNAVTPAPGDGFHKELPPLLAAALVSPQ